MTIQVDSTSTNGNRYSGNEFPPFIPPAGSTFNRTDEGKFYRWSAEQAKWIEYSDRGQRKATFDVDDFGAQGGSADDTAALQAAFDAADAAGGGIVTSGYASHRLYNTVVVGTGSFKTIDFRGRGMLATRLQWYGPTTLPVLRINGLKQYIWEGFLVENKVSKGTTVGILIQRDSGTGSQSGSCAWKNIRVNGFAKGIQIGNVSITQAGSEIVADNLMLESNDIGLQIQDGNSLDFTFSMLSMSSNGIGLQTLSGGVVSVIGGGAAFNTTADFDLQPSTPASISTYRSENSNRFLIGGGGTGGYGVTVSNCSVTAITNVDGFGIRFGGGGGPLVLLGNQLLCKVACSGLPAANVTAIGNAIADTVPVNFASLGGTGAHYTFFGNKQVNSSNADQGAFADEVGYISSGARVPSLTIDSTGLLNTKASVAGGSGFRLPHGTAPSSPVDGDMWTTTSGLFVRVNGSTVGPLT